MISATMIQFDIKLSKKAIQHAAQWERSGGQLLTIFVDPKAKSKDFGQVSTPVTIYQWLTKKVK